MYIPGEGNKHLYGDEDGDDDGEEDEEFNDLLNNP